MVCDTDCELLIYKIRVKLEKNIKRIKVPNYNLNKIPDYFKVHVRNEFALINSIDCEPVELETETRDIIREEFKITISVVKRKEKAR